MPSVLHSHTALTWMRRRLASRRSTGIGLAVTVALLVAAIIGAARTLPVLDRGGPLTFDIDNSGRSIERIRGTRLAVFSFRSDGATSRVGQARALGRGVLEVQLYEDVGAPRQQTVAVLLQADSRTLWAFTSNANKAKIRYIVDRFIDDAQGTLKDIADSDTFREKYQPILQALLRRAFDQAVSDPDVKQAIAELPPLQDVFDREFAAKYLAIVLRNSVRNLGDYVGGLTRTLWGQLDDTAPARQPQTIFNSPESRNLIGDRIREAARSKEVASLIARFGRPFLAGVLKNPDFIAVLQEMAADRAFAGRIAAIERSGVEAARIIARLLVVGDRDDRMHPFAATVLRGLLLDNSSWLVAFVTQDQLRMLQQTTSGGAVALLPRRIDE